MTESDGKPDPGRAAPKAESSYADQVFRSTPGMISGVLLLLVAGWLVVDAMVSSTGKTPWVALAAAPVFAFPVIAYTLRPSVQLGLDQLLVRNPLRTVVVPWAALDGLRAGYSAEVTAGGRTFQMWAVPVSLRQRNKANRRVAMDRVADPRQGPKPRRGAVPGAPDPNRAWSDQVVDIIREQAERNAVRPTAKGEVVVRWCWWVIAPTLAALAVLIVLIAV
ncbi:PH domain-containing protein [Kitasatospora viridis]|uniref:PH (Pleckstrin Homology) domain-containing protein n=1 Tax=Kitasatospora viridis TaxID=281105 RepID=A0A561UK00_9ACTN|nr:PH domain-containing protein [Kitasatospora viridis]TWF99655.1 PH (Pleckstrin Homology) domain-containing protein [Kitasatospora viridis]